MNMFVETMKLPPPYDNPDEEKLLYLQAGLEWLTHNTDFVYEPAADLPAGVQLFLVQFAELMPAGGRVAAESLGGMSQNFRDTDLAVQLHTLAGELLGEWYKPACFVQAENRWTHERT